VHHKLQFNYAEQFRNQILNSINKISSQSKLQLDHACHITCYQYCDAEAQFHLSDYEHYILNIKLKFYQSSIESEGYFSNIT